ncbi:MAG: hypothetical protein US69_C0023G0001, partial [candidate division TM6 bacterium GW2011_GWF2_38_10]
IINSSGSTLHLGGDFTIPASKVIHCRGSMVIDGEGNTLEIDRHAQLFLDNETTLTLRNMVIKTQRSFPGKPAIALSSTMCRLALDNVVVSLADDWDVRSGSLFFHNDVVITGTSALVYRTPAPSYVASGSCLYFDVGTTFSYAPAIARRDLLVLADDTSQVHFNGCSLKTTFTGLTLTKGTVLIENEVSVETNASFLFDTLETVTSQPYGTNVYAFAWSPDQNYLAVGGRAPLYFGGVSNNDEIQVYRFVNEQLIPVCSYNYSTYFIHALHWSPDGRYLFSGGETNPSGPELLALSFNGFELGVAIYSGLRVSPDGRYVAIFAAGGSIFRIYRFTGSSLVQVVSSSITSDTGGQLVWSPNGNYLAIGGNNIGGGKSLIVYRFYNESITEVASLPSGKGTYMLSWSPDSNYVVLSTGVGQTIEIYSFDGSSLSFIDDVTVPNCASVWGMPSPWSLDGQYIFVGCDGLIEYPDLYVYRFDGTTFSFVLAVDLNGTGNEFVRGAVVSPDGRYVACGGEWTSNTTSIFVKKLTLTGSGSTPYNPASSSYCRLGNSSLGAAGDINVALLGGATFRTKGNVLYDPV